MQSLMRAIAEGCRVSRKKGFDELRLAVERSLDATKLLIIDDCHEIFQSYQRGSAVKCFAVLRQIHDRTKCGVVLCGTNTFRNELERGEFSQAMVQLRRRGIWEMQVENTPLPEDLRLFSDFYKLPEPTGEAARLVAHIAKSMGLGKYTKFLHRAAAVAAKAKVRFTWDHFVRIVAVADRIATIPNQKGGN